MKILVLNRGSSSIKCYLYEMTTQPLWTAHLQWKNTFDEPTLKVRNGDGAEYSEVIKEKSPEEALKKLTHFLFEGKTAVVASLKEIDAIGHRVVHGGKYFKNSVLVDTKVKEIIEQLSELAPLHNPSELKSIEVFEQVFGKTPQVAVFDTAFHHSLPAAAAIYPGPYSWYEEGIQRYGFHGISYQYCSKRAIELLKAPIHRMVICHLGSGASLCAVQDGKSIDTTMGFTPLEGLMMDTRSGTVDPGILLHLLKKKKKSLEELGKQLNEESGLLGISGFSSDMRDVLAESLQGNARAKLALDVYLHRLNGLMGSMVASLKGLDVLIFTAGIGENAPLIRERVCNNFAFLGIKLDKVKNEQPSHEDREISSADSRVKVLVLQTQEALEIAREVQRLVL